MHLPNYMRLALELKEGQQPTPDQLAVIEEWNNSTAKENMKVSPDNPQFLEYCWLYEHCDIRKEPLTELIFGAK